MISCGDRMVTRITPSGTHRGKLAGIEPTGRRVEYAGAAIFRLSEGNYGRLSGTLRLLVSGRNGEAGNGIEVLDAADRPALPVCALALRGILLGVVE